MYKIICVLIRRFAVLFPQNAVSTAFIAPWNWHLILLAGITDVIGGFAGAVSTASHLSVGCRGPTVPNIISRRNDGAI